MSDFFKNLSENFHSVKLQLDKGRGEFVRLNRKSEENRSKNENDRIELVQVIIGVLLFSFIKNFYFRKYVINGIQLPQLSEN